jgi:hypothetical protein
MATEFNFQNILTSQSSLRSSASCSGEGNCSILYLLGYGTACLPK